MKLRVKWIFELLWKLSIFEIKKPFFCIINSHREFIILKLIKQRMKIYFLILNLLGKWDLRINFALSKHILSLAEIQSHVNNIAIIFISNWNYYLDGMTSVWHCNSFSP